MAALWTTGANAQTDYRYGFEGDVIADGWRVETTANSGTWSQCGETPHGGKKQMWVPFAYEKQDERLISPAIKVGKTATVSFWYYLSDYDEKKGSHYDVEISTDGGKTWDVLYSITKKNHYEIAYSIILSKYSGKIVNISWHAYDDNGNGLEYSWYIDDIRVTVVESLSDVVLESYKNKKTQVINVVKEKLGIGNDAAQNLVESAPCILKKLTTMDDAKDFANAINAVGGKAKMAPSGMYDPEFVSLFESFEEDGIPEGWTTVDADNDEQTWMILKKEKNPWMVPLFGDQVNSSWSWNNGILDPDNYLISPLLSDAAELNYWFAMNVNYPDHYQVLASTVDKKLAHFTQVLIDEKPEGLVEIDSDYQSIWYERTLPLPAGTKYVAFRHCNSKDNSFILIDNVRIIKGTATGIETVAADNKTVARKGIYNINGMKMYGEWESMPKGVYVVDGKKKVKN